MSLVGKSDESGTGFISAVAGTPTTIVTNGQGAGKILRMSKCLITNIDTANDYTITVYKVVGAAAAPYNDDYCIIKAMKVRKSDGDNGTEDVREIADMIIENGDSIKAVASAASKLKHDTSYWAEA